MALFLAFSGAILCGIANLFMRRSVDAGGTTKAFLVFDEGFSILVAILLGPMRTGMYGWDNKVAIMGLVAGAFLAIMMWGIGRAMEKGPPGLSVAILNSSSVVPAVIMVLLFGTAFGHGYGIWNAVGSLLVLMGLFWAGSQTTEGCKDKKMWLTFAFIAFWCHALFLVILQWRALLIRTDLPISALIPFFVDPSTSEWFMPMIFISATVILLAIFLKEERRKPKKEEVIYGFYGGVCNGACTYFLIKAAQIATPFENAMTFPLFAVALIMVCNVWGSLLYKENVHWRGMGVCLMGLFIGTVNWASFL